MNYNCAGNRFLLPIKEIVIQSPKKFEKTVEGFLEVSPFPEYSIYKAVSSKEPKVTFSANTCAILGMNNGKTGYLGHYAPELKGAKFKDRLEYDVKKMQDETGELSAVVVGGYDFAAGSNRMQARESFNQLAEIGEVLDKANACLSMIAAKRNPVFKENMAITKDRFIISYKPNNINNRVMSGLNPNSSQQEIEQILNNSHSIVEIDEGHKILFE